jgi:hypothetical protein
MSFSSNLLKEIFSSAYKILREKTPVINRRKTPMKNNHF